MAPLTAVDSSETRPNGNPSSSSFRDKDTVAVTVLATTAASAATATTTAGGERLTPPPPVYLPAIQVAGSGRVVDQCGDLEFAKQSGAEPQNINQ